MYTIHIIAVDVFTNEPVLLANELRKEHAPAVADMTVEAIAAWLVTLGPGCFSPDLTTIKNLLLQRIDAALKSKQKKISTNWMRLPNAGFSVWLAVELA